MDYDLLYVFWCEWVWWEEGSGTIGIMIDLGVDEIEDGCAA